MKGLLKMDWYTAAKQLKMFSVFIVVYAGIAIVSKNVMFMSFALMFLCMFPFYLHQAMENGRLDVTFLCMPVDRKMIVQERYLTILLCGVLAVLAGLVSALVMGGDMILAMMGQACTCILVLDVLMPLAYKFGSVKSRWIGIAALAAFFAATGMANSLAENVGTAVGSTARTLFLLLPAAAVVFTPVSYLISVKVYEKHEF